MKLCESCRQLYADEDYSYCLHDGAELRHFEASDSIGNNDSIVTVVKGPLRESQEPPFQAEHVFDEVAADALSIKIFSSDASEVVLGMKIRLKNLSTTKQDFFVTVKGLDLDGFEIFDLTIACRSLRPGEVKAGTLKQEFDAHEYGQVRSWIVDSIT